MPQILAASPPKAAPPPATKPATNADFTAYQLFVRDVLVRYPCGSAEFEEFQKMFRDYLRKKCTRFVALRRHDARARARRSPLSFARARADARPFEFERVRPQLLESRAKKLFGKKDKDLLATFHGFFEASLHDYEAKGEEARPPGARETLRRLDAAPAGREPAHDHARQGRAGGRRARSRHEPGHLGRRRARPAPRGRVTPRPNVNVSTRTASFRRHRQVRPLLGGRRAPHRHAEPVADAVARGEVLQEAAAARRGGRRDVAGAGRAGLRARVARGGAGGRLAAAGAVAAPRRQGRAAAVRAEAARGARRRVARERGQAPQGRLCPRLGRALTS